MPSQPRFFTPFVTMNCRPGCGACCIAPSISSPIPGMRLGKASGERCIQLSAVDNRCLIFGHPDRPAVCASLQPAADMCGDSREQAMHWLGQLEAATQPLPDLTLPDLTLPDMTLPDPPLPDPPRSPRPGGSLKSPA